MSTFLANALLYPLRAIAETDLGDEVDAEVTIPSNAATLAIPASVLEKTKRVYVPESDELRTIRWYAGTLSTARAAEFAQSDRLYDLKSGRTFIVDEVAPARRSIMGTVDTRVDMRLLSEAPLSAEDAGFGTSGFGTGGFGE